VTGTSGPDRAGGFGAFFRRYTRTWQHALATAALTAFGTLTFVHRLFAVVAILSYALPPVVLYLRGQPTGERGSVEADRGGEGAGGDRDRTRTGRHDPGPAEDSRTDEPTGTDGRDGAEEGESDEDDRTGPEHTWETATVPVEEALLDVAVDAGDAYAVGGDGTVIADDADDDDGWTVVVPDGPGAASNTLRGVAAVADSGVWFAGDGGAVGRLDPSTGRHVDRSAPNGDTTDVVDVAAAGTPGDETVLLVDGSGRVRRGRYHDGEVAWDDPVTPGSGSSLAGVTLRDGSTGYVCDTNQCVFETTDGGRSFVEVSPDAVEGTLTDVAATDTGECAVSDDDGVVHRSDGATWTPERLGDDPLRALAVEGGRGLASGDDGTVYERPEDGLWERVTTPATVPLRGVAVGSSEALAVGDDGTVLERSA
jgi:photosystem II stability/assembly factor-like uncharacterized protein